MLNSQFENGFIFLSRSLLDSKEFQNEKWLKVWLWCLLKANHTEANVAIRTGRGNTVVKVGRGQFIFGRKSASIALEMPQSTVKRIFDKLATWGNLDIKANSHYSIITIVNYDKYQSPENYKRTGKRTPKGQPNDTFNNVNNENKKRLYMDFVSLTEAEHEKLINKFGKQDCQEKLENLNNYVGSTGKKYKSHYHTILSWARNNGKRPENRMKDIMPPQSQEPDSFKKAREAGIAI